MTIERQVVARCSDSTCLTAYIAVFVEKPKCLKCGAPVIAFDRTTDETTLMELVSRSIVFPPAPLRVQRWRVT